MVRHHRSGRKEPSMTDQATHTMPPNVNGLSVWFEIPVSDLSQAKTYYEAVLNTTMIHTTDPSSPNEMVWFNDPELPGASGHLYPGDPAKTGQGNTVHMLAIDPLEEVIARVEPAGGKVISPIIEIPSGRFVYTTDPDGNSVGFFNWKQ